MLLASLPLASPYPLNAGLHCEMTASAEPSSTKPLQPSRFWELRDKNNLKSLGAMLEYLYIERGLL